MMKYRSDKEIQEAEFEIAALIWVVRSWSASGREHLKGDHLAYLSFEDPESCQKQIDDFCEKTLEKYSDYDWGVLNGKLSALRWVRGYKWDTLET